MGFSKGRKFRDYGAEFVKDGGVTSPGGFLACGMRAGRIWPAKLLQLSLYASMPPKLIESTALPRAHGRWRRETELQLLPLRAGYLQRRVKAHKSARRRETQEPTHTDRGHTQDECADSSPASSARAAAAATAARTAGRGWARISSCHCAQVTCSAE